MITLLFILIAYAIRKRFLPEEATRGDKVLYYMFSVFMTPLIGPWVFRTLINNAKSSSSEEHSDIIWPYVG